MYRNRGAFLVAVLVLTLPACSVTWREPEVLPLNPVRVFAAASNGQDGPILARVLLGLE